MQCLEEELLLEADILTSMPCDVLGVFLEWSFMSTILICKRIAQENKHLRNVMQILKLVVLSVDVLRNISTVVQVHLRILCAKQPDELAFEKGRCTSRKQ